MNVHSLAVSVEFNGLSKYKIGFQVRENRKTLFTILSPLSRLNSSPSSIHNGWIPHLYSHGKECLDFPVVGNLAIISKQRNEAGHLKSPSTAQQIP